MHWKWVARRQYSLLLASLLLLLIVYPVLRGITEGRLLFDSLLLLVFVMAIFVIFRGRTYRLLGMVLGVPLLLVSCTRYTSFGLPALPWLVAFHLLTALFFAVCVGSILLSLYREERITADSVYGAFCGYLLVGLSFSHLYSVLAALNADAFVGPAALKPGPEHEELRHYLLTYFSFITLTTVGYGEITPATIAARGFVMLEAVLGQFYLVVLMAELIGRRLSHLNRPPDAD